MADTVWIAAVIVLAGAWGWHAVADHHRHLHLLRMIRPGIAVPETRHDSWWHSLPRRNRAVVDAALVICAAAFGLAWQLSPVVAAAVTALAAGFVTGVMITRRFRARYSRRRRC